MRALASRVGGYGARLAIEGHDPTMLDAETLATRLADLSEAADRVEQLGDGALATARDEDDRETLGSC